MVKRLWMGEALKRGVGLGEQRRFTSPMVSPNRRLEYHANICLTSPYNDAISSEVVIGYGQPERAWNLIDASDGILA